MPRGINGHKQALARNKSAINWTKPTTTQKTPTRGNCENASAYMEGTAIHQWCATFFFCYKTCDLLYSSKKKEAKQSSWC